MKDAWVHVHPDFYVVDKPSGVSVHSEQGAGLVVQWSRHTGESLHLVHRLDRDTSGLLILARHDEAARHLGRLFARQQVTKFYLGISARRPSQKMGVVRGDMARSRDGNWKLTTARTRPAVTSFVSAAAGDGARLLLLRPWTGRTHQLRVAMKAMGAPLAGDRRYGGAESIRLALHAWWLEFPWSDGTVTLSVPPRGGLFDHPQVATQCALWSPPTEVALPRPPGLSHGKE